MVKRQAIRLLIEIADEWFGYDPERYYWTHLQVTDDGAVYCGAVEVSKKGTLTTEQVSAVKPITDAYAERRNTWSNAA